MKSIVFAVSLCLTACVWAEDVVQRLFWQVTDDSQSAWNASGVALYATLENNEVVLCDARAFESPGGVQTFSDFSFTALDFYTELINESGQMLVRSDKATISALADYVENAAIGSIVPTTAAGYYSFAIAIPEPTSAMLLLLGVAGLALKRKRLA